MNKHIVCSPAEEKFIRDNYLLLPAKQMCKMLNRSACFVGQWMKRKGLVVPDDIKYKFKHKTQYAKGHVPFTKGKKQTEYLTEAQIEAAKVAQFKPGQLPHNTLNDLDITIRKCEGKETKWIRLAMGKWQPLHYYVWLQAGNTVPENHVLVFADGDRMNCDISNIVLLSRSQHMLRNSKVVPKPKREPKPKGRSAKRVEKPIKPGREPKLPKPQKEAKVALAPVIKESVKAKEAKKIIASREKEKQKVDRERSSQPKPIKPPDLSGKVKVRLDSRTEVYITPGQDVEALRAKFLNKSTKF